MTVADDKAYGEFSCELIDSIADYWMRAIQVQVIGKLESVAHFYPILPSGPSLNASRTWKILILRGKNFFLSFNKFICFIGLMVFK